MKEFDKYQPREEFDKYQQREIADIAIKQTEEIILRMADIVLENRHLRKEVKRLKEVEKEYHQYINERCKASEQASFNMLNAAISGYVIGKDDREIATELIKFM